jgi:hypothetical protein
MHIPEKNFLQQVPQRTHYKVSLTCLSTEVHREGIILCVQTPANTKDSHESLNHLEEPPHLGAAEGHVKKKPFTPADRRISETIRLIQSQLTLN